MNENENGDMELNMDIRMNDDGSCICGSYRIAVDFILELNTGKRFTGLSTCMKCDRQYITAANGDIVLVPGGWLAYIAQYKNPPLDKDGEA